MGKRSLEIKWGLIFAGVALLWMVFEKWMGWHDEGIDKHATYTLFFFPVAILIYVLALREKRQQLGGAMSWKEGFISGLIIAVVVALLSPLSQYIVHTFISPEYFENIITYSVDNNLTTQEEAEAYFNLVSYMRQGFIGALIAGLFTSAVVALILRTK